MIKLSPVTRILLAVAVLALASGWYLPLWEIQLWAPQYPEGLNMKIWINRISGEVDIINGINHYIGMKPIKAEMFPEFQYMGVVLGALMAVGLLPVVVGRRRLLEVYVAVLILGGALGIYDYWRWGKDYGGDLNPKAAISVPGMTYSPPLIGYKNLLNFVAYSGPEKGGWVLIGSGAAATALLLREYRRGRRRRKTAGSGPSVALLASLLTLAGCSREPEPIEYGKDECDECRMTLVDRKYGAELISDKGKVFKFDDVNCLVAFIGSEAGQRTGEALLLVADSGNPGQLLPVEEAWFLKHDELATPMLSEVAAFATKEDLEAARQELGGGGEILRWSAVQSLF